jgi:nitrate/nitrite-specific signal transduction histidine kinase
MVITQKKLTSKYIIILGLIGFLASLSFLIQYAMIMTQDGYASMINISGRQRMLSQRIALLADELADSRAKTIQAHLQDSIALFEKSHQELIEQRKDTLFFAGNSDAILDLFFNGPLFLNTQVHDYIEHAKKVVEAFSRGQLSPAHPSMIYVKAHGLKPLLEALDGIVEQYTKETHEKVNLLHKVQILILCFTFLALVLIGIFFSGLWCAVLQIHILI